MTVNKDVFTISIEFEYGKTYRNIKESTKRAFRIAILRALEQDAARREPGKVIIENVSRIMGFNGPFLIQRKQYIRLIPESKDGDTFKAAALRYLARPDVAERVDKMRRAIIQPLED